MKRGNVSLLVTTMLRIVWSSDKEFERNRVIISIEIALSIEQINSIKSIVAPALPNLEIRSKLPDNLGPGISMIYHLNSVLILLRLWFCKSLEHLQEHTNIVSFGLPISIRIYFQPPWQPTLCDKRWIRVYNFVLISTILSNSREILYNKYSLLVLGHKLWVEIDGDIWLQETVWLFCVDIL